MLYHTLREACDEPGPFASWCTKVIVKINLQSGKTFFRTYVFDSYDHSCRACRNSTSKGKYRGGLYNRLASTGHTCEQCGNPFAGFVRRFVRHDNGTHTPLRDCWGSQGRLH